MNYQIRPNRFNILPVVVKNLLIINGLFFLATIVFQERLGIDLADILGLHYPFSSEFRPHQLVTYLFMHGSFMHIFFNMFALWMFGNSLENLWGPKRFLIFYIITGVGAALCHYVVVYFQVQPVLDVVDRYLSNPSLPDFRSIVNSEYFIMTSKAAVDHASEYFRLHDQAVAANDFQEALRISVECMGTYREDFLNGHVVVGASGSVFGILLAFGMLFPNTLLYIYFAIPIKAKWFVILYGALELYSGLSNNPGDNVAHFAHLGGMLFGFILIKYWQKNSNHFY